MKRIFLSILLLGLQLSLCGCSMRSVWSTQNQKWISDAEAFEMMKASDILFLGELHDNPHHHSLQSRTIRALANSSTSIGFEHLPVKAQRILDRFAATSARDYDELKKDLNWEQSHWPSWNMFKPLFRSAFESGARVIALDEGFGKKAQKQRGLRKRSYLPLTENSKSSMVKAMEDSHCGKASIAMAQAMVSAQVSRNEGMVEKMLDLSPRVNRQIFIVGAGHARKDWGLPYYLKPLRPGAKILSLAYVESSEITEADGRNFDLIWVTPPHDRPDPCDGMKLPIQKRGAGPLAR